MGGYSRFLERAIKVIGESSCVEGSNTDLHIQRFIKRYSCQGKSFEDYNKQKKTDTSRKPEWPPRWEMPHPV